ncbi:S41 family peptidase [Olivibacter domesticus]|uniref:N-terminal domain of Peptidase_S41 n=1 Tax=Olivibacter domesticus TaxID=407022 RepID=A0A1H7LSP6_OLID1|nr:S41 family peptidase [Olivibacter domesticus]SEL01983.1 N-terminal domain of Peptidase_S41 [Olivibacter domesticus]
MNLSYLKLTPALLIVFLVCSFSIKAQELNDIDTHDIVQKLAAKLTEVYPFPEIAEQYKKTLLKKEVKGQYKNLSEDSLAVKLTHDLREIHKDVHLRVMRNEDTYRRLTTPEKRRSEDNVELARMKKQNYGFKSVEINGETSTAYINIPGPFWGNQEAFEMAAAAMNMAAYSKYVILDIRHNPGGTGHMGRFIASYFYEAGNEKFYLNGFYKDRKMDEQEWTYSYVPGRRNPDAKVYILVGPGTGSASEGLAYAMQKLGRATIVGDTTAGAGIAGTFVPLKSNLIAFVPFKMVIGPNSNEGWEGIGVIPDVQTGKGDALEATRKLIEKDRVEGK